MSPLVDNPAEQRAPERASQEDPLVMYYVVRKDLRATMAQLMSMAGAGAVFCTELYRTDPAHAEHFDSWLEASYRKVALRASEEQLEAIAEASDCARVGASLLCLPPQPRSEVSAQLAELKPFTDAKAPAEVPGPVEGSALTYLIRPGAMSTTGKAMAQAGHAAMICLDLLGPRYSESVSAWLEKGAPGRVRAADDAQWERVKAELDCIVVRDAGLTQVEAGTETVLALPPGLEQGTFVTELEELR